jgi:hypothetical protein
MPEPETPDRGEQEMAGRRHNLRERLAAARHARAIRHTVESIPSRAVRDEVLAMLGRR